MASIIAVHVRDLPFATVIFIAGLASIPAEVDDAAKIDGATGLKKLFYVTLPLQLPIALVALLFGIVFTATDITVVYILTNGGPFNQTQMLTMWAFQTGIRGSSLGAGAAISSTSCRSSSSSRSGCSGSRAERKSRSHVGEVEAERVRVACRRAVRDRARVPVLLDADDVVEDERRSATSRTSPSSSTRPRRPRWSASR